MEQFAHHCATHVISLHLNALARDNLDAKCRTVALVIHNAFPLSASEVMVITYEQCVYAIAPFKVNFHELTCR